MANSYNELFGLGTHSEDTSLEFFLKLQETTGTIAQDSSSNNRDGTVTGMGSNPVTATGPNNWLPSCFDFDGTNDFVDLGNLSGISGDNHTLCLFMKLDADPPPSTAKAGFGTYGEVSNTGNSVTLFPDTDGTIYCATFRGDSSTTTARVFSISGSPSFTSWRKVCIKTLAGAGGWELRVDATTYRTQSGVNGVYSGGPTWIGKNTDATNNYFLDGKIAGVVQFSRKLTNAEEAEYFAGPEPILISQGTLRVFPSSWNGTTGTWNGQSNGTVSVYWELRKSSDNSVLASGTNPPGTTIGGSGTFTGSHYIFARASNDGGYDPAQESTWVEGFDHFASASTTMALTGLGQKVAGIVSLTTPFEVIDAVVQTTIFEDRKIASSELAFQQTLYTPNQPNSGDTINFLSTASFVLLPVSTPNNFLGITDSAVAQYGVPWLPIAINDSLGLIDSIGRCFEESVSSVIAFTENSKGSYGIKTQMVLTDLAQGGIGFDLESEISFQHLAYAGGSLWLRTVTHPIAFTSNANGFTPDKCSARYGDRKGPTSNGKLTLRSQDGAHEVVLRNPEPDNIKRAAFSRILRETRGGSLTVFRDPNWPTIQTLLFTIVAKKRDSLDQLQQFFTNTLGLEVLLVDWLGDEWLGIVTNPDEPATQDREGYWTVSFEFEGKKKPTKSGNQNLNLTQSATYTLEPP